MGNLSQNSFSAVMRDQDHDYTELQWNKDLSGNKEVKTKFDNKNVNNPPEGFKGGLGGDHEQNVSSS